MPQAKIRNRVRNRGARIGRKIKDKYPSRFKKPVCLARLVLEDLQIRGDQFAVTVSNKGNLPSHQVRINVYMKPFLWWFGEAPPPPLLVASKSVSLGILEQKTVLLLPEVDGISLYGSIGVFNTYFAVAFDPINDPFPISRIQDLSYQERNLLGLNLPSLPGWEQYRFNNDDFDFDGAILVPEAERTWKRKTIAELVAAGDVPNNAAIENVLHPESTPGPYSEFRYRVNISDSFFREEIGKRNVVVHASCQLYTYDQNPRDRGGFWLRLSNFRAASGESMIATHQPALTSPMAWQSKQVQMETGPQLNTITVRLVAERRKGQNNNAYFGNVSCMLKHRQVKFRWSPLYHLRSVLIP